MSHLRAFVMPDITPSLASTLVEEQFSQWAHLPIIPVEVSGHDNRTFRLGSKMLLRLPSAACYASKVAIEQTWLPRLASHISFPIPQPIAMGTPSATYPFPWSIYRWLAGKSANMLRKADLNMQLIAQDLAHFLHELHKIDTTGGPVPGAHNFYRGDSPSVYDSETRSAIAQLQGMVDIDAVTHVWEKALRATWNNPPVWFHGDLSAGNLLIKDGRLAGVIDFGGIGIGDPACDLVIAWTFLTGEGRKIFKNKMSLDSATWARARGWAIWKALITLAELSDKTSSEALLQQHIIEDILGE